MLNRVSELGTTCLSLLDTSKALQLDIGNYKDVKCTYSLCFMIDAFLRATCGDLIMCFIQRSTLSYLLLLYAAEERLINGYSQSRFCSSSDVPQSNNITTFMRPTYVIYHSVSTFRMFRAFRGFAM